jgi:hypothetical protein
VTLDDESRRLVWTHEGGRARHYNGALQVTELADGLTSVVWTAAIPLKYRISQQ